jgi:NADH:ubiquinone reductase (H+-translocating)
MPAPTAPSTRSELRTCPPRPGQLSCRKPPAGVREALLRDEMPMKKDSWEHVRNKDLHHVVVVSGGAAGLELATRLGRRRHARITLVDSVRAHLWKPMLHEVAAGSVDPGEYEVDYLAQAYWHGFHYRFGEIIGLDRTAKEVCLAATFDDEGLMITPPRSIGYDTLVIAIGSLTNDFGTPGVSEYSLPLETPAQAVRFHRRLVNACIRADAQEEPMRPGQLHVAIVGAGATGTELAAELHRTTHEVVAYGFDRIDPERDIRILLFEAAKRILPELPERISEAARRLLDKMAVEVLTNARAVEVTAEDCGWPAVHSFHQSSSYGRRA